MIKFFKRATSINIRHLFGSPTYLKIGDRLKSRKIILLFLEKIYLFRSVGGRKCIVVLDGESLKFYLASSEEIIPRVKYICRVNHFLQIEKFACVEISIYNFCSLFNLRYFFWTSCSPLILRPMLSLRKVNRLIKNGKRINFQSSFFRSFSLWFNSCVQSWQSQSCWH